MKWRDLLPGPMERGEEHWMQGRSGHLRGLQRIDPVWMGLVAAGVVALVVLFSILGFLRDKTIDEEIVRDNRILKSYDHQQNCFQSAAASPTGEVLVAMSARTGCGLEKSAGAVTSYDPVWRLWGSEELPFEGDSGAINPTTLGRLGETVWIRGTDGGLSRNTGDGWKVWLSQSRLRIGGRDVAARDIKAVTSAPDAAHTLVALRNGRAAIYQAGTGKWTEVGQLPGSSDIKEVLWVDDKIWVLSAAGLWVATISPSNGKLSSPRRKHTGEITELAATAADDVIAIEKVACDGVKSGKRDCNRLLEFDADRERMKVLLDNSLAPITWTLNDIAFVEGRSDDLILAGAKGVRRYSIDRRHWTVLEGRPVTHLVRSRHGDIAYAGGGFVSRLLKDAIVPKRVKLPTDAGDPDHIFFAADGRLFVETATGRLLRMNSTATDMSTVFERTVPDVSSAVTYVRSSSTHDFLVYVSGQVSVSKVDRRYRTARRNTVLARLPNATLQTITGDTVFAFVPEARGGLLIHFDPARPGYAVKMQSDALVSLAKIDETTVAAATLDGRLKRFKVTAQKMDVDDLSSGQPASGPSAQSVTDAAARDSRLALASAEGVTVYDGAKRAWETISTVANPKSVTFGPKRNSLLVTTEKQGLINLTKSGASWRRNEIIAPKRLPHGDGEALHDTLLTEGGEILFLGRDATSKEMYFTRYNTQSRLFRPLARVAANGRGKILNYNGSRRWLIQIGTRLWSEQGEVPLAPDSAGVKTGWQDDASGAVTSVEVDAKSGFPFVRTSSGINGSPSCLFRRGAFPYAQPEFLFALPRERAVLGTARNIYLYEKGQGEWRTIDTQPLRHNIGLRGNYLWLSPQSGQNQGDLLRVDLARLPAVDSCASALAKVPSLNMGKSVISSDAKTAYRLTDEGHVERANRNGAFARMYTRPKMPQVAGNALRALHSDGTLWIAYRDAVLRYDIGAQRWSKVAEVAAANWDQVTLAPGTGPYNGTIVASFMQGQDWQQIIVPRRSKDTKNTRTRKGVLLQVAPFRKAAQFGTVRNMWKSGMLMHFQFDRHLVTFSMQTGKWHERLELADPADRVGQIGPRLLSWNAANRTMQFVIMTNMASKPQTVQFPIGATPFVTNQGLPVYVTQNGGLNTCSTSGQCRRAIPERVPLSQQRFDRVFEHEGVFIVIDSARRAARFMPATRNWRPLSKTGLAQSLAEAQTEPLGQLRQSRSGRAILRTLPDGRVTMFSGTLSRRSTNLLKSVEAGTLVLANPDDGIALRPDGSIVGMGEGVELLPSIREKVQAIGKLGDLLWYQADRKLGFYPAQCNATTPAPEGTICEIITYELPEGVVAADARSLSSQAIDIVATDGSRWRWSVGDPRFRETGPPFSLPEVPVKEFIDDYFVEMPGGAISATPGVTVSSTSNGAVIVDEGGGRLTVRTPEAIGPGGVGVSWLRFDAANARLGLKGSGGEIWLAARNAFSPRGVFYPFALQKPSPQPDGTMLAVVPGGIFSHQSFGKLTDLLAAKFTTTGAGDTSVIAADIGGFWQDETFLPSFGAPIAQAVLDRKQVGVLTIVQDRRRPAVALTVGTQSLLGQQGFDWDLISDIGISADNRPLGRTPMGVIQIGDPLRPTSDTDATWRAQMMQAISAGTDKTVTLKNANWSKTPDFRQGFLEKDILRDAAGVDTGLYLLTRRGLARADSFERPNYTDAVAADFDSLRYISRLDGLIVEKDGTLSQIDLKTLALRALTAEQNARLGALTEWKVGPIRADVSPRGGFDLRIVTGTSLSAALGKDNGFRLDTIRSAKRAIDGDLFILTDGGLMQTKGEGASLQLWQAVADTQDIATLYHHGDGVLSYSGDGRTCRSIAATAPHLTACPDRAHGMVDTSHNDGGRFTARRTAGGKWQFTDRRSRDTTPRPVTLRAGRFSLDRFRLLSICDDKTHLIDEDGYHAPVATPEQWAAAQEPSPQGNPTGLFCAPIDRFEVIPAGTWMADPSGKWSVMPVGAKTFSTASQATSFSANYVLGVSPTFTGSLLRQSFRAMLIRRENGVPNEYLKFGSLAQRSNFTAQAILTKAPGNTVGAMVDAPDRFFAVADEIWAVSGAWIVPYGNIADASLQLSPEQGNRIATDPGCVITGTESQAERVTRLFCADGRQLDFTKALDGTHRLNEKGQMPDRISASAGALSVVMRRGEGVERFTFFGETPTKRIFGLDIIKNIQITGDTLHLVTTAGWYAFPTETLALRSNPITNRMAAKRDQLNALRDAAQIERTVGGAELCLKTNGGASYFVQGKNNSFQTSEVKTGTCQTLLSKDKLRAHYKNSSGTWTPYLLMSDGKLRRDSFSAGRFASDKAIALPVMRGTQGTDATEYCVQSSTPGIVIRGDRNQARGRARLSECTTIWPLLIPSADGSVFDVKNGRLTRRTTP